MTTQRQRRHSRRRCYTDDDRLFALRHLEANDGNVSRTARELGIPVPTLHQWARGKRMAGMIPTFCKRPLTLWHFRERALPVFCLGQTIYLDLGKLTRRQHAQLTHLMQLARKDANDPNEMVSSAPSFNLKAPGVRSPVPSST